MFQTIGACLLAEQETLISIETSTMVWAVVSFVLLLAVLGKFAWKPLLAALDSREKGIRDSIEDAEKAKVEAEKMLAEHKRKLTEAEAEVKALIEEGRAAASSMKEKILEEARETAQSTVERATREIEQAREQALDNIRQEAVDLTVALASKVVQRSLSPKDHEELIRQSMAEIKL